MLLQLIFGEIWSLSKNFLKLLEGDFSISIKIESFESSPNLLLAHQSYYVSTGGDELGVVDEAVFVVVD